MSLPTSCSWIARSVPICKENTFMLLQRVKKKLIYSGAKCYELASVEVYSSPAMNLELRADICSVNWVLDLQRHAWKKKRPSFSFMLLFALIFEFSCVFQVWRWWFLSNLETRLFQMIKVSRRSPLSLKSEQISKHLSC